MYMHSCLERQGILEKLQFKKFVKRVQRYTIAKQESISAKSYTVFSTCRKIFRKRV